MTEEQKPPPKTFALRALSKAEVQEIHAKRRENERQEREAKRPHPTALLFVDRASGTRIPGGYVETAGWVFDEEQSGDEFVTLKRVLGPQIPREQKIPSRGVDPGRLEDLAEFLVEEMKAGSEAVVLNFVDPVP